MAKQSTIGRYLVSRLEQAGLGHVFGIPGDYVLGFYDLLVASRMQVIGTCTEAGAGFAADGYARVSGLGAVCVTYCVGGLNSLNAVAGAYAEKSPLIVISGAPGLGERAHSPLLHHKVRDFQTQRQIYEKVTVAACSLEDPQSAPQQIDDALHACILQKRPVYLELPRDMVEARCAAPGDFRVPLPQTDPAVLDECLAETVAMLRSATRPIILAGVEIHRFGLQEELVALVEHTGFPVAATILGKSVISELHPQYIGVYEGAMGREEVRVAVESADCVLILGAFMTDINLGIYTANLDVNRTINVNSERASIKRHHFDEVVLADFIRALTTADLGPRREHAIVSAAEAAEARPWVPEPSQPMRVRRFFERLNHFLEDSDVVIADVGDSLFGAADLVIRHRTDFLSPAYYTSMGFAVPAAVGVQTFDRSARAIVVVGDGAFQMTGQELSTAARLGLNPIVFVLNNKGYTTERFIREGPYNDIHDWAYHLVPQLLRQGWGTEVHTEGELETALQQARANTQSLSILNIHLDKMDTSKALERLARRLGERA
ncbi:MAG TPA: thiamine pyrophosphate-binding protein [Candidatus Limnocylindrales bacterium]|nr:thiamine pyrophosphate-binding protein [Candidatus Limnocylindrales bacterium]